MDAIRWGQAALKLCGIRGISSGSGTHKRSKGKTATVAVLAKELGVPERTFNHRTMLARTYDALPAKDKKAIDDGKTTLPKIKTENRRAERIGKINKQAAGNKTLTAEVGKAAVLLCDPPWKYEHSKTDSRSLDNQYPQMTAEQLHTMPTGKLA